MEEIAAGARVREYAVEAQANGPWHAICGGTSIGHKKIDRFAPGEVQRLRLNVKKAVAAPLIRSFAAYSTQ